MIRTGLLTAALLLAVTSPINALDEKAAARSEHRDEGIKLSERQIDAGNFVVVEAGWRAGEAHPRARIDHCRAAIILRA